MKLLCGSQGHARQTAAKNMMFENHQPRVLKETIFQHSFLFMDNKETLQLVKSKFGTRNISTETVIPNAKVLEPSSKMTPAYMDPAYIPFYYILGSEFPKTKSVIQIGPLLGLIGAAFMRGCVNVEEWCIANDDATAKNIITSNLKLNALPKVTFRDSDLKRSFDQKFDFAFLTERCELGETKMYLDFLWKHLQPEGLLVVDYIHDVAVAENFSEFCRVKNREPVFFKTRYGVGIITR